MNFSFVSQGLQHASRLLDSRSQVNNIFIDSESKCIAWHGRKPGIQKNIYYSIEYQYLLDTQQYSILLKDSSFFQFYYQFEKSGKLKTARLAYYPKPVQTPHLQEDLLNAGEDALERQDNDLYDHLYNWVELLETDIGRPANTSHFRFDFDSKVISHSKSHLQFGAIQEFRVPANSFPLPVAFIELCSPLLGNFSIEKTYLVFAKSHMFSLPINSELIHMT